AGSAKREGLLISARWPDLPESLIDEDARAEINWLVRLISEIRSVRADMSVPPAAKAALRVTGASRKTLARLERHEAALLRLARLEGWAKSDAPPRGSVQVVVDEAIYALPLG